MRDTKQHKSNGLVKIVNANMALWLKTLETKDSKKVAKLYLENATFLPTVSGEFKRGQDGAESYFDHFLSKNPKGEVVEEAIISIDENSYLHVGMYNFELDGDGERVIVKARFDYLWKKDDDGEWRIAHHHSSLKPE